MPRVTKDNVEGLVYFVGVILLGLFYYQLKRVIQPEWLFVVVAITWLLVLRFVGAVFKKRLVASNGA
jgi:hypothetical protein